MLSLNDIKIYDDGSVDVVTNTPPPFDWNDITAVKRIGRIATMAWDLLTPRWNYAPRSTDPKWDGLPSPPQTFVFNDLPRDGKGDVLPLTQDMKDCVIRLNGQRTYERIMIPDAGWINSAGVSHYTQRLSWSCNHVVVLEQGAVYSLIFAPKFDSPLAVSGTFFDKDHRLHIHKFNAITKDGGLIKLGKGFDCYTPLVDDGQGMWARNDTLEFWPELPFTLDDGRQVVEYELYGYNIVGVVANSTSVLLRDQNGFKTNWTIKNPEVPA